MRIIMVNLGALMLARGGVALRDSADASRCYPDLWRTPAAARQAFHRQRSVTKPRRETAGGECHAPLRRATYQRAGAGKRPASLLFDPGAVDDLRTWLEERVGPLARFALEAADEVPAPVLAEPADASGLNHPEAARTAPAASTASQVAAAGRPAALPGRVRLGSLAQRLEDARPKQRHGVRRLDFEAWQAAAREAAALPSAEWAAWRAAAGTAETAW